VNTLHAEPRWLSADNIVEINRQEVRATAENHFVLNIPMLESAAARPKNLWAFTGEEDIALLAATLASGIGRNHAFEQGNKRTASTSALTFARINGYIYTFPNVKLLGYLIDGLIIRKFSEYDLADFLAEALAPDAATS
jgi:death-on-curing protein